MLTAGEEGAEEERGLGAAEAEVLDDERDDHPAGTVRGESARGGSATLGGTHGSAERMRWFPRFCPESNRNMVVRDGMVAGL